MMALTTMKRKVPISTEPPPEPREPGLISRLEEEWRAAMGRRGEATRTLQALFEQRTAIQREATEARARRQAAAGDPAAWARTGEDLRRIEGELERVGVLAREEERRAGQLHADVTEAERQLRAGAARAKLLRTDLIPRSESVMSKRRVRLEEEQTERARVIAALEAGLAEAKRVLAGHRAELAALDGEVGA